MIDILVLAGMTGGWPEQCREVRYKADGSVIVSTVAAGGASADVRVNSRGDGSASSSAAASSSSNGSSSSSASTSTNGLRKTVTVRRDVAGCTITIDERPIRE